MLATVAESGPGATTRSGPATGEHVAAEQQGTWISPYGSSGELRAAWPLLSDLGDPGIVERAMPMLASDRQEDRFQGLLALREQRAGWSDSKRRDYISVLHDGRSLSGVEACRVFSIVCEPMCWRRSPNHKAATAEALSPAPAAAEEPLPPPRPFVRKWTIEQLAAIADDGVTRGDRASGDPASGDPVRVRVIFVKLSATAAIAQASWGRPLVPI